MTIKEKVELNKLLKEVFESGDIPCIGLKPKVPGDSEYLDRLTQDLKRDERLRPLFNLLDNNRHAVDFYLLGLGQYFRDKAQKAEQLHTDCFS